MISFEIDEKLYTSWWYLERPKLKWPKKRGLDEYVMVEMGQTRFFYELELLF
jgi:hypothetical protein